MLQLPVAYIGNFAASHSTENEVRKALESLGVQVDQWQENDPATWGADGVRSELPRYAFVLWTRTGWTPPVPHDAQHALLVEARLAAVPVVGYHLDRWWGLDREQQVTGPGREPFFDVDVLCTADGGHDDLWAAHGVNHVWFPPAIGHEEAVRAGRFRREFEANVAFVGNASRYHREWPYRQELIRQMRSRYGRAFKVWEGGVRGQDLADLYASVQVVVGDSCLAGDAVRYWSDRIPETLGRGGVLVHPAVEGLDGQYEAGVHLATYPLGDWAALFAAVDGLLRDPAAAAAMRAAGRAHVAAHHTYRNRMADLAAMLEARGMARKDGYRSAAGKVRLRRGGAAAVFDLRAGTADGVAVDEVWREGVYRLEPHHVAGKVVVDVGANVGAFALWAAAAGAAQVVAVEPVEANAAQLRRNLALNPGLADRVTVVEAAVGPWDGEGRMALAGDDNFPSLTAHLGTGGGKLTPAGTDVGVATRVVTFGALLDAHLMPGDRCVAKVDIEGGEFAMFAAAGPEVFARVDRIVMEFHGAGMGHVPEPAGGWGHAFGDLVTRIAEWGHVEVLGRPSLGGMLYCSAY